LGRSLRGSPRRSTRGPNHLACDTYANLNTKVLGIMSDAVAHAVLTFAQTTSAVNGTDSGSVKPSNWKGGFLVK
jgi:hypothetical protein